MNTDDASPAPKMNSEVEDDCGPRATANLHVGEIQSSTCCDATCSGFSGKMLPFFRTSYALEKCRCLRNFGS